MPGAEQRDRRVTKKPPPHDRLAILDAETLPLSDAHAAAFLADAHPRTAAIALPSLHHQRNGRPTCCPAAAA
jgi:hypothetical protein